MTTLTAFRIVPLARDVVDRARRTMTDEFGHALKLYVNPSHGNPCRFTLRQSPPGEELLLMSYSPFKRAHPYAEVGPIFIRRNGDAGYAESTRFPPEIDPTTRIFRCYNAAEEIIDARVGTPQPAELIAELFSNPAVDCIHVRSLTYGCFTFKIERA